MTTQELTKEVMDIKSRVAGMNEKVDEACIRLGALEREVKEQGKLLQSIDKLAMGLSRLDEKLTDVSDKMDEFGQRITSIELEPGGKWKSLVADVIKILVGAVIAVVLLKIGLK